MLATIGAALIALIAPGTPDSAGTPSLVDMRSRRDVTPTDITAVTLVPGEFDSRDRLGTLPCCRSTHSNP